MTRHDQMIEHPNIDQRQRVPQAQRDEFVRSARLGDAGGVIVREDQARCVVSESLSDHLAWVDVRGIEGAAEQLLEGDEPVTRIEIEAAEDLKGPISELRDQKARSFPRRVERAACV